MVVVAQAARLVVDHPFEFRQPLGDRQDLVDLLLVLGDGEARLGMGENEGEFVGDRVGIDRHRDGAQHLRRHDRPVEPRPVAAHDRDGVATADAVPMQSHRHGADDVVDLVPGPALPDAEILVTKGWPAAESRGVAGQQLWECVRLHGGRIDHGVSPLSCASRALCGAGAVGQRISCTRS